MPHQIFSKILPSSALASTSIQLKDEILLLLRNPQNQTECNYEKLNSTIMVNKLNWS